MGFLSDNSKTVGTDQFLNVEGFLIEKMHMVLFLEFLWVSFFLTYRLA